MDIEEHEENPWIEQSLLARYEDFTQLCPVRRQLGLPARSSIRPDQIADDVRVDRHAERVRRLLRHRPADHVEHLICARAIEAAEEGLADERRRVRAAKQILGMAFR